MNLTIAVPSKGRLYEKTRDILERIGIKVPDNGRKLYVSTNIDEIKVLFARAKDIPWYVEGGAADVGITGEDMIAETGADVEKLVKLNYGKCKVVIASKEGKNRRIATKLPTLTKKFFPNAKIILMDGGCEAAPRLGIADAIVDQVSTGDTLSANNLIIDRVLFESNVYLIANKDRKKDEKVREIALGIEGVITAQEKRYIMLNVTSEKDLKRVVDVVPCLESPTVLSLAKKGCYSIHSVVDAKELMPTIRKIKEAGGKDILVLDMSRVVS